MKNIIIIIILVVLFSSEVLIFKKKKIVPESALLSKDISKKNFWYDLFKKNPMSFGLYAIYGNSI